MKIFTITRFTVIIPICLLVHSVQAQMMFNPADPIVNYNSAAPPKAPASGKIGKWVRTPSMTWNTDNYKCYIYDSCNFRLRFPQTYKQGDGKKYPILVFYHGDGEVGPIDDNEKQLLNGGQMFDEAEENGTFDGYIIFMQHENNWGLAQYLSLHDIIDSLTQEYGGDPYRVIQNGLSGGGQAMINELEFDPTIFVSAVIMQAALPAYATPQYVNLEKFTPIWDLDGALDNDPDPAEAQYVDSMYQSVGADYTYTNFPTRNHDSWDSTWLEPGFWPFLNNTYRSNPWPLFGRTTLGCKGIQSITIGILSGLAGYQWRKNGVAITGATSNSLVVTDTGTYDARVLMPGYADWSDWSHVPVHIVSPTTSSPTVAITQPSCTIGSGAINITYPTGTYLSYTIDSVTYQSGDNFTGLAAKNYHVMVKDTDGCVSPPTLVVINQQPLTPPTPTVSVTQPSCTVATGTINITRTETGLLYSIDSLTYQPDSAFIGLAAQSYPVMAKNIAGCISPSSIAVINQQPVTPIAPVLNIVQPTCDTPTATINIAAPTGSGLLYSFNGGTYQSNTSMTKIAAGVYKIAVQSDSGCVSASAVATILTEPASCNTVVSVYPNPFSGVVYFNIVSPESGQGSLEFYSLLGQRLQTEIESDFVVGIPITITCPMEFAKLQPVVYVLTIGKKKYSGTLLPQKF